MSIASFVFPWKESIRAWWTISSGDWLMIDYHTLFLCPVGTRSSGLICWNLSGNCLLVGFSHGLGEPIRISSPGYVSSQWKIKQTFAIQLFEQMTLLIMISFTDGIANSDSPHSLLQFMSMRSIFSKVPFPMMIVRIEFSFWRIK